MWGKLTIVEAEDWIYVAPDHDPDDWVARFEKVAAFPAYEWAERMVSLHNSELRDRHARRALQAPPTRYAPFDPRSVPVD